MNFQIATNQQIINKVERIAFEALVAQAEILKTEANVLVPEADGDLKNSAKVTPFPTHNAVVVSYDTAYAVRQHEDLTLHHPDPRNPKSKSGRKPRWLELTAEQNSIKYFQNVARKIKDRMGRGGL